MADGKGRMSDGVFILLSDTIKNLRNIGMP